MAKIIWNSKEQFDTHIERREFTIKLEPDFSGYGYSAFTPDYEPGSPFGAHSMKSREDAMLQLVEKIEEAILTNRI